MALILNGDTGVSAVQSGVVQTEDIANGAITPAKTQMGALPSMVRLNTANGYGSTNTKIRRFLNIVTNQGTDITSADSATLGASFTINANGVYAVSYGDSLVSIGNTVGLSLNTTSPTSTIYGIPISEVLGWSSMAGASYGVSLSWCGYLSAGAIIRAHTDGAASGANVTAQQFTITRAA